MSIKKNIKQFAGAAVAAPVMSALLSSATVFAAEPVIATVPVTVNVAATVAITPPDGLDGAAGDTVDVAGGANAVLTLTLASGNTSVSHRAQARATAPAAVSHSRGNVSLTLAPQQFGNAEISLFSVNGRRVMSGRAGVEQARAKMSRSNVAAGVYLLSVKGARGNAYSHRITHSGGRMNIDVAFTGGGIAPAMAKMTAEGEGEYGEWEIKVTPLVDGYLGTSYTFEPVEGGNEPHNIVLESVSNVIKIANAADLAKIGSDADYPLSGDYILTGNITLTGTWTPIGDNSNRFTGTFDGDGYTISGLSITTGGTRGLFGVIGAGGTVKNLAVSGTITANAANVGGIAADNYGTIENCWSSVSVTNTNNYTGGIVGWNRNTGIVRNCYNTGDVRGNSGSNGNQVGGIAGLNQGAVEYCFNTGAISSTNTNAAVGGIIGDHSGNAASVKNSVSLGQSVSNTNVTSGNIGRIIGTTGNGPRANNYANSAMTGRNSWPNNAHNNRDGADITGAEWGSSTWWTTAANWDAAAWNGDIWDFTGVNATTAPRFKAPGPVQEPAQVIVVPAPIEIANAADLAKIGVDAAFPRSGRYILTDNITLTSPWTPIGDNTNRFTGTFDGDGYTISGLTITSGSIRGLFGAIDVGGVVKNLGVEGTITATGDYAGGITARNYGTVEKCWFSGSITSTLRYNGGIVGSNAAGAIVRNCYNTGSITGTTNNGDYIGGIVGYNTGTIEYCYNTGAVSGALYNAAVGGIAGQNNAAGIIRNTVSLGAEVKNTTANSGQAGRIVGWVISGSTFDNNYANSAMTGSTDFTNNALANEKNGEGIDSGDWSVSLWWTTYALWDADIWDFSGVGASSYPVLK